MGCLPMLPTINLNATTASVLVNTFHPSGVLLTVKGASAGSSGYTSSPRLLLLREARSRDGATCLFEVTSAPNTLTALL